MRLPAVSLLLLCAALAGAHAPAAEPLNAPGVRPRETPLPNGQASRAYYVLPEGRPYSGVGFDAGRAGDAEDVLLRFGDEISVAAGSVQDGQSWFRCSRDGVFFTLPGCHITFASSEATRDAGGNLPLGRELFDPRRPLPIHYAPNDMETVPPEYAAEGYKDRVLLLRREARERFIALIEDAEREGVNIRILSAYRSARYQSGLYASAIAARGALQNSVAKPGHSEHQLGTACDLTSDEILNGLSPAFEGTNAFAWLRENGHRYGIYLSYPRFGVRVTGYVYEPWHFRYYGGARWSEAGEGGRVFFSR